VIWQRLHGMIPHSEAEMSRVTDKLTDKHRDVGNNNLSSFSRSEIYDVLSQTESQNYRQNHRQVLSTADLRRRRPLSATMLMSSVKYAGAWPDNDWCIRHTTLYSTRRQTGSQCNWTSRCEMWSHRLAPVMRRAAAFCTDCNFWMRPPVAPYSSELQ